MAGGSGPAPLLYNKDAEKAVLGSCLLGRLDLVAEVRAALPADAFYPARHATIWRAICALADDGVPPDPLTVPVRIKELGERWRDPEDTLYLHDLYTGAPGRYNHGHVAEVARWARLRRVWETAVRLEQQVRAVADARADVGGQLERLLTTAHTNLADLAAPVRTVSGPDAPELDVFLKAADEDHYDWLIPGLLERGDRLILTGAEGRGKSTLLRQIGIQAASGIHPFGGDAYQPLRVLLLDLENSSRQLRRQLRPLRLAAGHLYAGGFYLETIAGLDLKTREGATQLLDIVGRRDPDLLVTGPAYKMVAGPPTEEEPASIVASYLDRIRASHQCAILLESHTPHAAGGGRRPERPYGASLWLRWPEFGLYLSPKDELHHWRGQREEREWPAALTRGGSWPFTRTGNIRDDNWIRIREACERAGMRLSQKELERVTGINRGAIQRSLKSHRDAWDAIPQQLEFGQPDIGADHWRNEGEDREWYR